MKNQITQLIKEHFFQNARKYILFSVFFAAGFVLAFAFGGDKIPEEEIRSYVKEFLETGNKMGTDGAKTFFLSMSQYLKFAFFMVLFSVTVIGVPLVFAMTVISGFSYGMVFVCLFQIFGAKTILLIFSAILPHAIISLPCTLWLSGVCLDNAGQVYQGNIRFSKTILYPVFCGALFLCVVSVSALIQGFIEPFLFKLISAQFL